MTTNQFQLYVRRGPEPGQVLLLTRATVTVGREPMSDIVFNDPELSRQHARLTETDDGYQIQDLGSTNGTYVSGHRIGTDPVALQLGDEIVMGSGVTLVFQREGDEQADAQSTQVDVAGIPTVTEALVDVDSADDEEELSWDEAESPDTTGDEESPPPLPEMEPQPIAQPGPTNHGAPPPGSPAPEPPNGSDKRRRNMAILGAIIALFLCCGCLVAFGTYLVIDSSGLLEQLSSLP